MTENVLISKLRNEECIFGANYQLDSPWIIEMIGQAGFDFIMLDGEHGMAYQNLPVLILAARAAGIASIVRVPDHERSYILQALEAGAAGIQIPMVDTAEQAKAIVEEVRYAPLGKRGFSTATRAANYGKETAEETALRGNSKILLSLQIESAAGLKNAPDIAKIPGIDMIFFGPADLSQSMGFPGKSKEPLVVSAIQEFMKKLPENIHLSTSVFSGEDIKFWKKVGVKCFLTWSTNPLRLAMRGVYEELKSGI